MKGFWLCLFFIVIAACEESLFIAPGCSPCFRNLIRKEKPLEVWRYRLEDDDMYLVIPDCCDQLLKLFDTNCQQICSPSGGFSGKGDGLCPDFYKKATVKELVWTSR